MFEDGRAFVERRLSPRIRMTVRRHIQYWVAMSPARRVVASVLVAAAIGGTTFAACRASDVTGPNFRPQNQSGVSRSLISSTTSSTSDGLVSSDHDSDSDNWPMAPASHNKISDDDAMNDEGFKTSVETTFPVTEAVFNTCNGEGPILLNGYIKERMRTESDPNDGLKFKLTSFKDTRGFYGTFTYYEDYYDDNDGSWKKRERVVRYHNRESLLDRFEVGPLGLPFQSEFEAKTRLEREGADKKYRKDPGDDLFVFVRQRVKIDKYGPRTENVFRTECN